MKEIIEELSQYSQKQLERILNKPLLGSKYLISTSYLTIHKVLGRDPNKRIYINDDRNTYKNDQLEYYYKPLTTKKFAEIKINNLSSLIEKWSNSKFRDWCYKQFVDVYGEEYVDRISEDQVVVWWPEITIRNSCEQSHVMRDVYLKFLLRSESVKVYGIRRGTLIEEEIRNDYVFSHCSTSNIFGWTNDNFCFGDTAIANLRHQISNSRIQVFKNLKFFLQAINEYLSWESLEGVPYRKIDNVICDRNKWKDASCNVYEFDKYYNHIINNIDSFSYEFSDRPYILDNSKIAELLTEAFPEDCYPYLEGRSVRDNGANFDISQYSIEPMIFKGGRRQFTFIPAQKREDNLPKRIHNDILQGTVNLINNKFEEFYTKKKIDEYNAS